jgi:hypothetical protein
MKQSSKHLDGVRLLLSYPSPSEEEWADVLHRPRMIAVPASPCDILAVYEMDLGSRGVRTFLEREANETIVELRQLARDGNVPDEFSDDYVKLALLRASER